jgi:hypothetical protein
MSRSCRSRSGALFFRLLAKPAQMRCTLSLAPGGSTRTPDAQYRMPISSRLEIDLQDQCLRVFGTDSVLAEYAVSTARNGAGERIDSECTPRGQHVIAAKIGAEAAANAVFVGRIATGEIYSPALVAAQPAGRDWILTRILWLSGCEPGFNQGGACDTYARYIYLHGTPDETPLGQIGSRGCIRMRNADIMALFACVEVGTLVTIA